MRRVLDRLVAAALLVSCQQADLNRGDSAPGASANARCLVAPRSVLARTLEPDSVRGWIMIDSSAASDSAPARLIDSDGYALDARWRRSGDSFVVAGFNDFVRLEFRIELSTSGAQGSFTATSDAALERDSTGSLREFRRTGVMTFMNASCDSMPAAAGRATIDMVPNVTARAGIRFDPSTARVGAEIGSLVLDSIDARKAFDSTSVGTARFRGAIQLQGWTMRHPDADAWRVMACFEADSASAARLPRWQGDERRPWFCVSNRADAARALGPPSEGIPAAVVIDSFTIHRGLSDEVNSARFVRLVRRGTAGAA